MVNIMNKEILRTIKFTLFSISAGVIELSTFALLYHLLKLPYWPCYLVGLSFSVIWNFTLNREYTFKSANNIPKAMTQVFFFYLVFTPVSTILGNFLEGNNWNGDLVTILLMVINFVTEYLYDRFYVFRDSIDTKK